MIRLPAVFQNGMILQRGKPVAVWGTSAPSEHVCARIQNVAAETVADSEGKWCLRLPGLTASDSETLTVRAGDETAVIEDVAVGEVWLAGGQSNMEFQMRYEKHLSEVKPACSNANIRFFDVPEIAYDGQLEDFDYSRMGFWRKATPEDIEYFTAVGYYFARALETDLHVPVGIVGCNWGGTTASAWMTRESVEQAGKPWMDKYRESISALDMDAYWQRQHTNLLNDRGNPFADPFSEFVMPATRSPQEIAEFFGRMKGQIESFLNDMLPQQIPGCLYEHMLMTIVPYTVRGVLWYQGESDEENGHADLYASMLTGLIHDWRAAMQDAGLPFLVVQLPGWERWLESVNNDYMTVRECQQQVADTVDNVWLCSISDVGEQFDIHPKNKLTVGERLALLARGYVYGEDILCDAPRGVSATCEGKEIRIAFTGAEGGLEIRGDELAAMEVICDGKPAEFTAAADGEILVLTLAEECSGQAEVRFAKTAWYLVNLYNKAGIPAVPFTLKV